MEPEVNNVSVAVVGAGASGLASAAALFEAGVKNVVILEASVRIGGRINSVKFGEEFVEAGAQWIHGIKGSVAYKIASDMDLLDDPESGWLEEIGEEFYYDNGEAVDEDTTEKFWHYYEQLEELQEDYDTKKSETVGAFFDKAVRQVGGESRTAEMLKDYMHRELMISDAFDNWYEGSLFGTNEMYEELPGIDVTFKSNHKYSDLLEHFTSKIPPEAIRLETRVQKVINKGDKINLLLGDDELLEADYVIFTPSLGVLKWAVSNSLFQPQLPLHKVNAIKSIGFGSVGKILLRYEEPWWPSDEFEGFAFLHKNPSNYTEAEAARDWTRSALGMYAISHRPNMLLVWLTGAAMRHVETLTDEEIKSDAVNLINRFLSKDYPNLPLPEEIMVTRWHSDPHVRGSYSYQTIESVRLHAVAKMAEPAMDGRLLFGGEATHPHHFSTVHGAIEAGRREAERIIEKTKTKGS